jgi:hypothetical protein
MTYSSPGPLKANRADSVLLRAFLLRHSERAKRLNIVIGFLRSN